VGIELVGGDTTAGPLTVGITVIGQVPSGQALLRSGARPGHDIWVSGRLGDARLALEVFRGRALLPGSAFEEVRRAMELPEPRLALGSALRGLATAAIDLSDGLAGDLGHVMRASGVGATIQVDRLPRSAVLAMQSAELQYECLLAGGDDYELLFTAPTSRRAAVEDAGRLAQVAVTRIGSVDDSDTLRILGPDGQPLAEAFAGFDHFK
jgi:thiamine-monophosphate kinase